MDISALLSRLIDFGKKYRYVILILVIGIVLMLIPGRGEETEVSDTSTASQEQTELSVSELLANVLSKIEGAGKVEVLLTVKVGEETIYQKDEDITVNEGASTTKIDTVVITDTDRNQAGLIRQVNPPIYLGAIVVCQGADSPRIQLAIIEAVSKLTGLGADKISVLKMK